MIRMDPKCIYSLVEQVLSSWCNKENLQTDKYMAWLIILSKYIDSYQLVALLVVKVTIETDQWKVQNGNVHWHRQWSCEFVWYYQVIWRMLHLTVHYYTDLALLIVLIMEEEEQMVGRQFNS